MDKNKAIERIKKKYLEDYKRVNKTKERIIFIKNLLKESEESGLAAYIDFFRGCLDWLNQNYEKAEEYFKNSISLDKTLAYPWLGLGNVYWVLKKYDRAEEYYRKAIELDDKFAHPWNWLGNVYWTLKKYDRAEEYYRKAIELDDKFAYPWNGLGNVYSDLNKYERAEEYYRKSIELDEKEAHPWNGLGNVYFDLKEYENAESAYKNALVLFDAENDQYWISRAQGRIIEIEKIKRSEEKLEKSRTIKRPDPIVKVLNETIDQGIQEKAAENKKKLSAFFAEKSTGRDDEPDNDYFQVLRRWNSYTPIIADNYYISKGGGYFLQAKGIGIVIDPGFNFIDNFKGSGHIFHEIRRGIDFTCS